jgi:hypothetical protein
MPLTTEQLQKLGLDNMKTIIEIVGDNSKLVDLIKKFNNENDLKFDINFNMYKMYYIIKKYTNIFIDNLNYEIDVIFNTNMTYFDILLNIFFLILVIIVLIIMYWDSVYRIAKKNSKCSATDIIINDNKTILSPYVYIIYIADISNKNTFTDNYLIKLTYDFNKSKSNMYDYKETTNNINNEYSLHEGEKNFKYYDLNTNIASNGVVNTKVLESKKDKLVYIITDDKNNILNTDHAFALKKFVEDYWQNPTTTNLRPIYDIQNAFNKNKYSD